MVSVGRVSSGSEGAAEVVGRRSVGWALAVCRGLGHPGRLGVVLVLVEGSRSKQELVRLVGGSRASVYRHVQALTRLGLVESRVMGMGRAVHHVVELTTRGRVVVAGLQLANGPDPSEAKSGGSVRAGFDVPVTLGRHEVRELLQDAWRFLRWRFLRGQVDEGAYWERRGWLKQLATRVGVPVERDVVSPERRDGGRRERR